MHDLVAKITENMEFWIFLYCGLSVILQRPAPWYGWGYWKSKVRIVIHMAQEYYSFMMNRFFETLFIQLMASLYSVLNVKALVGAFNQEKALLGAFSVIVQPVVEPMDRFTALVPSHNFLPSSS